MEKIIFKKLHEDTILPTHAHLEDAGWDIYSYDNAIINPGEAVAIHTGFCAALPEGTFGAIYARSGLATKQGLAPSNKVGVIDSNYRGEWIVSLYNHSQEPRHIGVGDRIAQVVIQPYVICDFEIADELDETERGNGGFGSSGK